MDSVLLILALVGILAIIVVFKQQHNKNDDEKDNSAEGSEE